MTRNSPPPFEYGAFWEDLILDLQDPEFFDAFVDATITLQADYQTLMLQEELEEGRVRNTHDEWSDSTGRKFWVHKRNTGCDINGCAIHNPSYHPLSDAKQFMREDKSWLIERVCNHGIGHPDPDSASFISKMEGNTSIWVHGCDGCCRDDETADGLQKIAETASKCYCGCSKGAHMGKPRGCIQHGFHEYEPEKSIRATGARRGWGDHPSKDYEGMTPDMYGYEGDY